MKLSKHILAFTLIFFLLLITACRSIQETPHPSNEQSPMQPIDSSTSDVDSPPEPTTSNEVLSEETNVLPEEKPDEPHSEATTVYLESSLLSLSGALSTVEELENFLISQATDTEFSRTEILSQTSTAAYYYYVPELTLENYHLVQITVTERGYHYYFLPKDYDRMIAGKYIFDFDYLILVTISPYIETDDIRSYIEHRMKIPPAYYGDFYEPGPPLLVTVLGNNRYATAEFPQSMAPYQNVHGLISYRKVTVNPGHVTE